MAIERSGCWRSIKSEASKWRASEIMAKHQKKRDGEKRMARRKKAQKAASSAKMEKKWRSNLASYGICSIGVKTLRWPRHDGIKAAKHIGENSEKRQYRRSRRKKYRNGVCSSKRHAAAYKMLSMYSDLTPAFACLCRYNVLCPHTHLVARGKWRVASAAIKVAGALISISVTSRVAYSAASIIKQHGRRGKTS